MTVTESLQQYLTIYLTYLYKYSMHGIFKYKMLKSALTEIIRLNSQHVISLHWYGKKMESELLASIQLS